MNPVGIAWYLKKYQIVFRLEFFLNLKNKVIKNYIMLSKNADSGKMVLLFFLISKHSLLVMKESFALKGKAYFWGRLKLEKLLVLESLL